MQYFRVYIYLMVNWMHGKKLYRIIIPQSCLFTKLFPKFQDFYPFKSEMTDPYFVSKCPTFHLRILSLSSGMLV
jgi:hypothetical protein